MITLKYKSLHWKLITKIEKGDCTKSSRSTKIKVNNQLKTDDSDLISNIFANNLEFIFSTDESVRELDNPVLTPSLIEDNDTDSSITGSELLESLKKSNSKAAFWLKMRKYSQNANQASDRREVPKTTFSELTNR
ncbi:hypothetical protein BpHYR1_051019 [Brachionus plicatilis]|uniref:Uncharacterized protein n=1 Tax=Brachionus plicatilis TaxID=10195 RepID=A0A3M7SQU4_BRAPC|nr:hypothetical protein BpHYR1_051019 [Brachionus plicatilis]